MTGSASADPAASTRVRLWILPAYAAATAVMTSPYVNWLALGTALYPGDARLVTWVLAWNHHALLGGQSLFDANIYYPAAASLAYNDPLVGIALVLLPVRLVSDNPILVHNLAVPASFLLNGLAMHALAYRCCGRHVAAFAGGIAYAFSFYMLLHGHGHLSLIWAWLLPLSFVLHDRWVERPTLARAAAWGLAVLLQALASWYLAVITAVATVVVAGGRHLAGGRDRPGRRLAQIGVIVAAGAAVVWPLAAPYRASIPAPELAEVRSFSADWAAYVVPPLNTLAGRWWTSAIGEGPRWIWGERTLFLGWIAMALAVAGALSLASTRRWRTLGPFVALVVVGAALSFGPAPPGSEWRYPFDHLRILPGVAGIRAPARFALLVVLGVAVLAACGAAAGLRRWPRAGAVAAVLIVPAMLAEWFVVGFPGGRPAPVRIPEIYRHPALAEARALVSLPDYTNTPQWPLGADYLLYSTVHWRPIVNGFGRTAPPGHASVLSHMRAFPGPNNARRMRELGVEYVVLHAARLPGGATDEIAEAMRGGDYDLVAQIGTDYLFRVRPAPGTPPDGR